MEVIGEGRFATTLRALSDAIQAGSNVVEIGASDASFRSCFPDTEWLTVDKFGTPDVVADINGAEASLPFETGSQDVVICTEVLEHLTLGSPLVREIARVLAPTGVAVISVPNIVSLRSRLSILSGRLPSMAASGDCGPPLGGSGINVGGQWVASHVVDFNEARLVAYLQRGGLHVRKFHEVPIEIGLKRILGRGKLVLPTWLYPRTMCDFVLVSASPMH